jgi:hypothetical protein
VENWNYTPAKAYADSIDNVITRRLTQFFLNHFVLLAFQKYAIPENSEIDLLCYVKIVRKIVTQHDLIRKCLDGVDLDSAWKALADELEEKQEPS